MIQIKKEYNNGYIDVLEIYNDEPFKLQDKQGILWNATEEEPITIDKRKLDEFVVTDIPVDEVEEVQDVN